MLLSRSAKPPAPKKAPKRRAASKRHVISISAALVLAGQVLVEVWRTPWVQEVLQKILTNCLCKDKPSP